jgi:hypothetical protein
VTAAPRSHAVPIGGTCALLLSFLLPPPVHAAREWYDYYLSARDRLIPAGRCEEAIRELDAAIRMKPASALNEQTYGLQFIDYLPYYQRGRCRLKEENYQAALADFRTEEERGPVKKSGDAYKDLLRLRAEAVSQQQARVTRGLRDDAQRLLREAADLVRRKSYDEALSKLAQAEVAAKGLDPEILRQVTEARDRIRATQDELQLSAAREKRIEQRLAEAGHLLDEGRATEAVVGFDDVLKLDPQNARALEGKKLAQDRILAATTRQSRAESFRAGKALFESGQYEQALAPLTDAAADPQNQLARQLLERARQVVEGMRKQKDIQAQIDRLMSLGERLLVDEQSPEAQVAFESVLRLDAGHARALERLSVAERRTREAFFERWFPNEGPGLSFFAPRGEDVEGKTVAEAPGRTASVAGVATDDRGIDRVEFRLGGQLIAEQRPGPALDAVASARLLNFQREFPLEPGPNELVVTAFDAGGLSRTQTLVITRRLRFYESRLFLPSAFAGALGMIGAGFVVQRARRQRARRRRFNPYIAGAPVLAEDMFFGREKLTARILNVLHHNSLMITGERRIGKTTFLYHLKKVLLAEELGDYRFFPVFVDLQGVPEQGFFHALMGDVVESLSLAPATRADLRYAPDARQYDGRDFSHDLQRVLEELRGRSPKKVKLALLIDEVDVLNEYSERVNQRLRGIFMKTFSENLVAVMSGVGIKRSWTSEVSPWYNFFDEIEITAFTREEAEALIKTPVAGAFRYEPKAVERILELSGQKPYLVQKLCIHAVNHMLEEGRTTIRVADVEAARTTASQEASGAGEAEPTGVHASA